MRRTIHAGSASDTWVPACAGSTRVLAACADVPDCDGSEPGQLWLRQRRLNGLLRPCWAPYFSWSPREVSKRRRPRLRRSARCADYPAVLESAGGRRKLAALRQSTAESPARSCAHRRRNGDWGPGWRELVETAGKPERLRYSRPKASTPQPSSYRRRPERSELKRNALRHQWLGFLTLFEKRHWTPACAGVTKIELSVRSLRAPPMVGNGLQPISRNHFGLYCACAGTTSSNGSSLMAFKSQWLQATAACALTFAHPPAIMRTAIA